MGSDKLLKSFLDLMNEKNWILRLKPGAEKTHQLPVSTQTGGMKKEVKEKKELKVDKGILNGRPFLKEAIEVSRLIALDGRS